MCQPFVKVCQRTGCSLPLSLPLCLFPARCWIGSINKTTLKMKVQTLGDISSLTSCSLFGSLSTNHWAGPQEVTICGHHGDRVCGWVLKLMCYLEQMKYDTERGGTDGNGEMDRDREEGITWKTKSWTTESQAPSLREGWMKREETRPLHLLCIEHKVLLSHVCWLQADQAALLWLYLPTPCCQVLLLLPISILSSAALHIQTNQQTLNLLALIL